MPSDYERIRTENLKEYGEGTRHLAFLGRLYTDRTHFIYEILQNAEDAKATKIHFDLFKDRLEIRHDGRPFNEEDVRGICGICEGTKAEDLTQIGKFGIGFKSVYAYTARPEIHSCDAGHPECNEHFCIEHYVRPSQVEAKYPGNNCSTIFSFPFNTNNLEAEKAFIEISSRLCNLNVRTLLFLRNIKEIEYTVIDGSGGTYVKETQKNGSAAKVTVIGQNDTQYEDEEWLVFARPVQLPENKGEVRVEIAFRITEDKKTKTEQVIRISESPLVVFFPTEKETRLGFLIQGPYRTTPARDNIPKEDDWNKKLIEETAALIVDALLELKMMGFLTVNLLKALPVRMIDFPPGGMFQPIVDSVYRAFIEQPLLPTDDGNFVPASQAKIARSTDLRKLLSKEQLQHLFSSKQPLHWLSGEITKDSTPDLHSYLTDKLGIQEITPDKLAGKITKTFLEAQTDDWIIELYKFLSDLPALWRAPSYRGDSPGTLRKKPFIRRSDGQHVKPFKDDGTPNIYISIMETSEFPTVKQEIVRNEQALEFLKKLGFSEPDTVAEVIEKILPKYENGNMSLSLKSLKEEHGHDISKILSALKTDSQRKKENLIKKLKETPFLLAQKTSSPNELAYKKPGEVYFQTSDLEIYFQDNPDAYFLIEIDGENEWEKLGVKDTPRLFQFDPNLSWQVKYQLRGNSGHTRDIQSIDLKFDGLDWFLKELNNKLEHDLQIKMASVLWGFLIKHLDGLAEWQKDGLFNGKYCWFYYSEHSKHFDAAWLKSLRDTSWLPSQNDSIVKPSEITLEELPPEFERNEYLAKKLQMKTDEMFLLARKLGVDINAINVAKQLQQHPDLLREFNSRLQGISNPPEFPERHIYNPLRRKEKLIEEVQNASDKSYESRERSIRTSKNNIDQDTWLRNQYTNDDNEMICQICKEVMPFKKQDGDYYFEAVEALSKDYFRKEHEAQFLALCPLCAAKYKEFIKRDPDAMRNFRITLEASSEPDIPIQLGDSALTVRFVETHFHDLIVILREAD